MILGGASQKLYIYSTNETISPGSVFDFHCELSAHENAITKIQTIHADTDLLIASASKDGYVRLWRVTPSEEIAKFHKNVKNIHSNKIFLESTLLGHEESVTGLAWLK